jgi:hypothetical protein
VTTPAFDDDLRLAQCVEDLAIEQLVAQPGVKALVGRNRPFASVR